MVPPSVPVRVEAREAVRTAHLTWLAVAHRAGPVVRPNWVPLPGRIDVDIFRIAAQWAVQRGMAPTLLPGDAWAVIGLGAATGQRCGRWGQFWRLASVATESFLEHGVAASCCKVGVVRLDATSALRDTVRLLRGACCTQSGQADGVARWRQVIRPMLSTAPKPQRMRKYSVGNQVLWGRMPVNHFGTTGDGMSASFDATKREELKRVHALSGNWHDVAEHAADQQRHPCPRRRRWER